MRFAICSAVYEAARPYLADFTAGVSVAARGRDVSVLLAVDRLDEARGTLGPLCDSLPVTLLDASAGTSPTAVRRHLLSTARQCDADILVFTDCDDVLEPDALASHAAALEGADFSYGDQILIDSAGRPSGDTLFGHWNPPWHATGPGALLDGNFMGFSAAAIWRSRFPAEAAAPPPTVVATDWWVFTMLLMAGRKGARAPRPVVRYRQYAANANGLLPDASVDAVRCRASIAVAHFDALPEHPEIMQRRSALARLRGALETAPGRVEALAKRTRSSHPMWYADVLRIAATMDAAGARDANAV